MSFKEINVRELESPVKMINDGWMLVTAGVEGAYNTMTASWGAMGELWNRDVAFVFIRPQRYTYEFMEKNEYFSLSFFTPEYKDALKLCGSKSGRDIDKAAATGLTPVSDGRTVYFEQASTVIICRKLACQDLDPKCFLDASIEGNYPNKDYHRVYVGEIVSVLKRG